MAGKKYPKRNNRAYEKVSKTGCFYAALTLYLLQHPEKEMQKIDDDELIEFIKNEQKLWEA